jgi:hypothetical protein
MRLADYLALGAAAIAFALSAFLWFGGSREEGLFVAVWVPSILTFATVHQHLLATSAFMTSPPKRRASRRGRGCAWARTSV